MVSAWLPALFGVLVIVIESTDLFSSEHTSGPLRHIWMMLFGPVTDPAWRHIHTGIRKAGHMAWLRHAERAVLPRMVHDAAHSQRQDAVADGSLARSSRCFQLS